MEARENETDLQFACRMQEKLDEHIRFEMDLLVMLCERDPEHRVVAHGDHTDYFGAIWDKVVELLKENEQLARDLKLNEENK